MSGRRSLLTTALLVVTVLLVVARVTQLQAGENAGATAELSWRADSAITTMPLDASASRMLYLRFTGLQSVSKLTTTVRWWPGGSDSGYVLLSDSIPGTCGYMLHQSPEADFLGDSLYGWTTVGAGSVLGCVALRFAAPQLTEAPAAVFCLSDARVMDSAGQVDIITPLGPAILGQTPADCPPVLFSATPEVVDQTGLSPTRVGLSAVQREAGGSSPLLTVRGTGLGAGTIVRASGPGGTVDEAEVLSAGPSYLSVALPVLRGSGPWDLVAINGSGTDTLHAALSAQGGRVDSATFLPLIGLDRTYQLPSVGSDPWSPSGRYLALRGVRRGSTCWISTISKRPHDSSFISECLALRGLPTPGR